MQNTLQFERSNPLQQMTGTARAIALPHEHAAQRFPSFPALERTAVMQFNAPFQWDVPGTEAAGMLMRQAAFPLWLTKTFSGSSGYCAWYSWHPCANWAHYNRTDDLPFASHIAAAGTGPLNGKVQALSLAGYPQTPVNLRPVMAIDLQASPYPYFFVPSGCNVTFNMGNKIVGLNATTLLVDFVEWAAPGVERSAGTVAFAISANFTSTDGILMPVNRNRWVRPFCVRDNSPGNSWDAAPRLFCVVHSASTVLSTFDNTPYGGSITLSNFNATTAMVPAAFPTDFDSSPLPWSDTRLTAVAGLFTNVTKALNKEGTVLAARVAPTVKNVWNVARSDLTSAHPAEKAYLPLQYGLYTYAPPSTDLAEFWDYTYNTYPETYDVVPSSSTGAYPVVRLDNTSLVNCFVASDSDSGTSLAVNLDWHVEFRSTSQLWPIGLSSVTLETLHQAQLALVAAGFFFSNETHKETIAKIVQSLTDRKSVV